MRRPSQDAAMAIGFGVAAEIEGILGAGSDAWQIGIAAGVGPTVAAALWVRRSRPLLAISAFMLAAACGTVAQVAAPGSEAAPSAVVPILTTFVLAYSLGAHGGRRAVAIGAPQPVLLVILIDMLQMGQSAVGGAVFFAVFVVLVPVTAGRLVRSRTDLVARLREQEHEIAVEKAAQARAAVAVERIQVAEALQATLVAGMASLVDHIASALAGPDDGADVAAVEAGARALLAETRAAVVSLDSRSGDPTAGLVDPPRPLRVRVPRDDAAVTGCALATAAMSVGLLVELTRIDAARTSTLPALIGSFAIGLPIALGWRWPLAATVAVWCSAALMSHLVVPLATVFTAIGLTFVPAFGVALFEDRRRAVLGLATCVAGELAVFGAAGAASGVILVGFAWTAGRVLRDRSELAEELREQNALLTAQREASLRRAVLEERAAFARELHDDIGHRLTVIALQAGAARKLWASDPPLARAALAAIEGIASEGLDELRAAFDARLEQGRRSPGLADIGTLVNRARAAGLDVQLEAGDGMPAVSPDVDLAAFRVVQEALTNVLRHAPGSAATVTVRPSGGGIELVVSNRGDDTARGVHAGGGHGLRGMRERVEVCGGTLVWSRLADGGFEVRTLLPAGLVHA